MATWKIEVVNLDQLRTNLGKYPEVSATYISRAINAALAIISRNAGKDTIFNFKTPRSMRTGLLQASFNQGLIAATLSSLTGSIGPTVKYAKWVEGGTAAHVIEVVKRRTLANQKAGLIFGPRVNHPGTAPNPFMARIVEASQAEITSTMERALDLILEKIATI